MIHRKVFWCLCLHLFIISTADAHGRQDQNEDEVSFMRLRRDTKDRKRVLVGKGGEELKPYIVVYKESDFGASDMTMAAITTHTMVQQVGGEVLYEYDTVLNGMAATLTVSAVQLLEKDDGIDYIVKDTTFYATTIWGLDRIDQQSFPLDGNYRWEQQTNAGAGVNVCVSYIAG